MPLHIPSGDVQPDAMSGQRKLRLIPLTSVKRKHHDDVSIMWKAQDLATATDRLSTNLSSRACGWEDSKRCPHGGLMPAFSSHGG
jgi:hypothetical protein